MCIDSGLTHESVFVIRRQNPPVPASFGWFCCTAACCLQAGCSCRSEYLRLAHSSFWNQPFLSTYPADPLARFLFWAWTFAASLSFELPSLFFLCSHIFRSLLRVFQSFPCLYPHTFFHFFFFSLSGLPSFPARLLCTLGSPDLWLLAW